MSWLPAVCTNPTSDLYYACFAAKYASDAGTSDASLSTPGSGATTDAGDGGDAGAGEVRFRVAYVLELAEAPAYPEIDALDADHDGKVTEEEQRRYLDARVPRLADGWLVEVDGVRVRPRVVASHLDVAPGEGGLDTLRIASELSVVGPARVAGAPAAGSDLDLHVRDDAFDDHPGWRSITAGTPDELERAARPRSDGGLGKPPRTNDARFVIRLRARPPAPPTASPTDPARLELGVLALVVVVVVAGLVSRARARA